MELYNKCGGYRRLDVYTLASIIQLATLDFCRRFLNHANDPCGRQFDQMTQAARSGVKNLVEGSERKKTSVADCIRLLDVGRASLAELRDDYTTWLLTAKQVPWPHTSPEAKAVFDLRLDPVQFGDDLNHDSCVHILAQQKRFSQWLDSPDSFVRANALLILISRAIHTWDKLLDLHAETFKKEGGFHEKMTAVRVEAKQAAHEAVSADTPQCPECGGPMRLRNGKNGKFWGCAAYPTCHGTRPTTESHQEH